MTCQEMLQSLGDYVDGALAAAFCAEFENHLEGCFPCRVVIDNLRHTIRIYRHDPPCVPPPGLQQRLDTLLLAAWQDRFKTL